MNVAVLGGGQLGRMLALAGVPLGLSFRALDPRADAPIGAVARLLVGGHTDPALLRELARGADVATYELEQLDPAAVIALEELGVPVRPGVAALRACQDRLAERSLLQELSIPCPSWVPVGRGAELALAADRLGFPLVVKTATGGYDGKGQLVVRGDSELRAAGAAVAGRPAIAEAFVPFRRELSLVAVRALSGATAFYPLVENVHREGVLHLTTPPDPPVPRRLQRAAECIAKRLLDALGYVGVLAVELFEHQGELLVNELAPRVHNSGHWTIDAAATSQFENHLRAIVDLPLGETAAVLPFAMVNLVGRLPSATDVLAIPGAHVHLYGKRAAPGRKLGHVTITGSSQAQVGERVAALERLVVASRAGVECAPDPLRGHRQLAEA